MSPAYSSRRSTLSGAACLFGCAGTAHARTAGSKFACVDLTANPTVTLSPQEQETHCILLLAAMALVFDNWGVDRRRPEQVAAYAAAEQGRRFQDYLGHNIGALLVDRASTIVCFALNRNVQLNSTLEHAEARAVRDAIQIANAAHPPSDGPAWSFTSLLQGNRLYATLEPCAQCSGIMELANLGSVIYGQDDPGQHHVANVLYNLNNRTDAPLPIRATFQPLWNDLASAYRRFLADAPPASRTGLTSFLATVAAYRIYRQAATTFATMQVRHAENAAILRDARAFRDQWRDRTQSGAVPD